MVNICNLCLELVGVPQLVVEPTCYVSFFAFTYKSYLSLNKMSRLVSNNSSFLILNIL